MATCEAYHMLALFLMIVFFARPADSARLYAISDGGNLVSVTCNSTLYFDVCVSSLESDPRSRTADREGLAGIALDISITYGMEIISRVNELKSQANSTGNTYMSTCLNNCVDEYSDAIGNLQDSAEDLKKKSYGTVNTLVTAAMTDSDTCEDGFNDMSGYKSPLTKRNQKFSMLCSNALAITNLLV